MSAGSRPYPQRPPTPPPAIVFFSVPRRCAAPCASVNSRSRLESESRQPVSVRVVQLLRRGSDGIRRRLVHQLQRQTSVYGSRSFFFSFALLVNQRHNAIIYSIIVVIVVAHVRYLPFDGYRTLLHVRPDGPNDDLDGLCLTGSANYDRTYCCVCMYAFTKIQQYIYMQLIYGRYNKRLVDRSGRVFVRVCQCPAQPMRRGTPRPYIDWTTGTTTDALGPGSGVLSSLQDRRRAAGCFSEICADRRVPLRSFVRSSVRRSARFLRPRSARSCLPRSRDSPTVRPPVRPPDEEHRMTAGAGLRAELLADDGQPTAPSVARRPKEAGANVGRTGRGICK